MPSAYHNVDVAEWVRRQPTQKKIFKYDGVTYERVVTLDVYTQEDTGRIVLRLDIDEVGDGPAGWPSSISFYDVHDHKKALHDTMALAAHCDLRARVASVRRGWCYWDGPESGDMVDPTDDLVGH